MATFTNTATLSYNGVITSSNTTVGEILEQLSVSKTAVRPIYSRDDDVTYVHQSGQFGQHRFDRHYFER